MSAEEPGLERKPDGLRYVFPATTENAEVFIGALHGFLAEKGLGALAFDMELLAREALVNAVHHGSANDPSKSVAASLRLESDRLVLHVEDQGTGWDWRSWSGSQPHPTCESGRGLYIIGKYSDKFQYNDCGSALTIYRAVPMEVPVMHGEDSVELVLEPRVSAQDVPALRELFSTRIREGARQLVLDFSRVESLDSMGIGLLVATHNSLCKLGGSLKLKGVSKDICQLLTLMRLDKHFSIQTCPEAQ